jgi:lipopolysaccharide heptosyltransferase I
MARSILVVRLGALGDLVHALPAVAALRAAWPDARIDWLVDGRYAALLAMVPIIDRAIVVGGATGASTLSVLRALRRGRYDAAIDLQGLLKSAAFARFSGARDTIGFATAQLRERAASLLYTTRVRADDRGHVIRKNLSLVRALGIAADAMTCPLVVPPTPKLAEVRTLLGAGDAGAFAVINPGAGWPNKQWPADRYGAVAAHLGRRHGLPSLVAWGPGELERAERVAVASEGAARVAPATSLADLVALARAAALFVAGDTGPLQLAAAVGTPVVGVFGPTNPARNGPWADDDVCVSRFDECECHHKRRCRRPTPCIETIAPQEVIDAVDRRLAKRGARG